MRLFRNYLATPDRAAAFATRSVDNCGPVKRKVSECGRYASGGPYAGGARAFATPGPRQRFPPVFRADNHGWLAVAAVARKGCANAEACTGASVHAGADNPECGTGICTLDSVT